VLPAPPGLEIIEQIFEQISLSFHADTSPVKQGRQEVHDQSKPDYRRAYGFPASKFLDHFCVLSSIGTKVISLAVITQVLLAEKNTLPV
jgi:hypothetical protein